ncbi:FaeA/PapI family transcriptional regulator [Kluyvera intermedia]|uniref:FaeA/PapI family transcriptional regulator n=1 Tax=Kluyvera intermedia TaxID=61648 RepID=UPI00078803BC|nr:FaeA/PapI family transcriptional regulator [Kluyvera intermedia]WQD29273.1 FaeA/PapI family transcriptional regulator [Kluyvera intermedia]VDZ85069.1 Uncharacterised protein [Kluyvera intermedia]
MRKNSEVLQQQSQQCLSLLAHLHQSGLEWNSSREVADRLDISVYLARLRLLNLQAQGQVNSSTLNGESSGRGKTRYWKRLC